METGVSFFLALSTHEPSPRSPALRDDQNGRNQPLDLEDAFLKIPLDILERKDPTEPFPPQLPTTVQVLGPTVTIFIPRVSKMCHTFRLEQIKLYWSHIWKWQRCSAGNRKAFEKKKSLFSSFFFHDANRRRPAGVNVWDCRNWTFVSLFCSDNENQPIKQHQSRHMSVEHEAAPTIPWVLWDFWIRKSPKCHCPSLRVGKRENRKKIYMYSSLIFVNGCESFQSTGCLSVNSGTKTDFCGYTLSI